MGRFLHHHDQLLAGALGDGVGIGPAIFAHMIGILIVAGVVWLGTILGSEQGIAGTVAMRSAFGINGRYIASVVMFIVGSAGSAFRRAWLVQPRMR